VSRRLKITVGAIVLAFGGLWAIWPVFLLPPAVYDLVYGWRYPKVRPCGDATLTDAGPGAADDRYVIDFGFLPLDAETDKTFQLCALPREWMAVGLDLELPGGQPLDVEVERSKEQTLHSVELSVSLADRNGRVVISRAGALGGWTWSYGYPRGSAFVYSRDSMFAPKRRQTYMLHVAVLPGNATGARGRLLVRGGGWKAASPPFDSTVETLRDLRAAARP
jgi:hypothetical protein